MKNGSHSLSNAWEHKTTASWSLPLGANDCVLMMYSHAEYQRLGTKGHDWRYRHSSSSVPLIPQVDNHWLRSCVMNRHTTASYYTVSRAHKNGRLEWERVTVCNETNVGDQLLIDGVLREVQKPYTDTLSPCCRHPLGSQIVGWSKG